MRRQCGGDGKNPKSRRSRNDRWSDYIILSRSHGEQMDGQLKLISVMLSAFVHSLHLIKPHWSATIPHRIDCILSLFRLCIRAFPFTNACLKYSHIHTIILPFTLTFTSLCALMLQPIHLFYAPAFTRPGINSSV